jgi:hypothetical protein
LSGDDELDFSFPYYAPMQEAVDEILMMCTQCACGDWPVTIDADLLLYAREKART